MTLPKDKKIKHEHIESMKLAVEEADIRSIHPDKMEEFAEYLVCLLYTSPSPRDRSLSRMPSSA